ncbi:S1 family peptidase [Streptosporangium sp. DT93]|uniref:S1 family peptidase n=1 Tax=Streptosporangium sp. DT93 TaxID=3393428 RepID=UPI003CF51964
MPRNHTAVMGRALALAALTALAGASLIPLAAGAGGAGSAQEPPSPWAIRAPVAHTAVPRPARTASPSPRVPWIPPDMLAALQRDLGLTREQVQERLLNEIVLSSAEARLRKELGVRFGGSWFDGLLSRTLVVATTSAADGPRITAAGAVPAVVRWSLAQLTPIRRRIDEVLSAHPAGMGVRYIDVRLNKVVVLSRTPAAAERIIRSIGVNPAAVVVLPSTEQPGPVPSPASPPERVSPGTGAPAGPADACPVRWACAPR